MTAPRVSIIVPTYNNAATLARSLESLVTQDYANFHVVVVDDCSFDDSIKIAKEYERRFPGIIRSEKNERNLGAVKNFATSNRFVEGKYFMLGGPDDTWEKNFLSEMVAELENSGAAACLSTVCSQFSDNERVFLTYPMLCQEARLSPKEQIRAVVNGVISPGQKHPSFASFFAAVVRTEFFTTIYPNDQTFWYIEEQMIVMQVLCGGLTSTLPALYTRHRFRESWQDRYPNDAYGKKAFHFWPRLQSAICFLKLALTNKALAHQSRKLVLYAFGLLFLYQVVRPALGPQLVRMLPPKALSTIKKFLYHSSPQ